MRARVAVALFLGGTGVAQADGWLVAEAPAALAVSDAQQGIFRAGVMPAFGAYADNDRIALGVRLRTGVLRNGPAPGGNRTDPGMGGLTAGGLAMRFVAGGGWAEAVVGGGMTGHDLVPVVEGGLGWMFRTSAFDLGPSVRYVRVIGKSDDMDSLGSADLALLGLDVRFGKDRRRRALPVVVPTGEPVERHDVEVVGPVDPDADAVAAEREVSCAEVLDGCPLSSAIVVHEDRIVLDERVLFDLDRARVRGRGREVVAEIVKLWRAHPDWKKMTIEGHADVRGTDEYNLTLSTHRAERVREVMLALGVAGDTISAVGFGRSRLRDQGTSEEAHQKNRRVEFVIDREVVGTVGGQP